MAVYRRQNRKAGAHNSRGVRQHDVRFTSRHFLYRRSRQYPNRRFEDRQMFRYYYKKARMEKWIEISRDVLCTLLFSTSILRMPRCEFILLHCLLRYALWLSIFLIVSLGIWLSVLYFQKDVLRRRIAQAWKLMKRRRYIRYPLQMRNARPIQRSVNSISEQENSSFSNKSKLEHFLDIITKGFGQEDGLAASVLVDSPVQTEPESVKASSQTLHEANGSETKRRVNVSRHLSFIDFIEQLRNVDRQCNQQASISSQNETVRKYKEILIEKVNLADRCGKITCAKELYEFMERNWDEWFPRNLSEERTCD